MKKYNVGIIGYSWAAGAHIEAINKTSYAQVTALCSSRKLDPAEISAKHGGTIKCYTDLAQMLADPDLHAVSICSYPADHAKQAIMAAAAGKHLIIEKPLALTWKDCLAIEAAVVRIVRSNPLAGVRAGGFVGELLNSGRTGVLLEHA